MANLRSDVDPAGPWRPACLICRSRRLRPLPAFSRAHLVRCRDCATTFAGRCPTDAELEAHYADYGHGWFDSPLTRARYRALLDTFESHRQTNRIFDSGCGAGYFLAEARARGWQVHGSEYSALALELNRVQGHDVVRAPITPETYGPDYFDVITAFEVVEHLRDPMAEAAVLAHSLRPGGLLYCTTPNFNAASRRVLGARWSVVSYPEHLCYFTLPTLRGWLARFGFEPVAETTSGVSLTRLREGLPIAAAHHAAGGGEEQMRTTIERSALLRTAKAMANATLGVLQAGDTIKATFRLRDGV